MKKRYLCTTILASFISANALATVVTDIVGEGPRLKPEDRIQQSQFSDSATLLPLGVIRRAGMLVFSTPFNKADGFGDGPFDSSNPDNRSPASGNRPTLQGNGTFLRVNGLDAQSCLECHNIVSNATVPATTGVGGVGGIGSSPLGRPDLIDVADQNRDGVADFTGRLINPPFLFGSGGVELLGREMTADLQAIKAQALANPGIAYSLNTKGVNFGSIVASARVGNIVLDTSRVVGVDDDLVVRPFGRKGEFSSVRSFDLGAMAFHHGMQATELVGEGVDQDGDTIVNEITEGDLSVLSIFNTTMETPRLGLQTTETRLGFKLFVGAGCASCHRTSMITNSRYLGYKLTGSPENPFGDIYYRVDLTQPPMSFTGVINSGGDVLGDPSTDTGGIVAQLYSDLKRHDMGEGLKESLNLTGDKGNREFITARLWGIADTAPYLHDGRALTLGAAIAAHDSQGSEAAPAAQSYARLTDSEKNQLHLFLMTLRTPENPNADVLANSIP